MTRRHFRHLSWTDRLLIEEKLKNGKKPKQIAQDLGFNVSTIYAEIKRGVFTALNGKDWTYQQRYSPDIAEESYQRNLSAKGPSLKIGNDHALAAYIESRIIDDKYSPGAVVDEIELLHLPFTVKLSRYTIYRYIEQGVFGRLTMKNLPMGKRKRSGSPRKIAAKAPRGKSIESRPSEIDDRETFGHWEMDTVVSRRKGGGRILLVLTERLSRKEFIMPIRDKSARSVVRALNRLEKKFGAKFREIFKTITCDNGCEFADADGIERSCLRKGQRTIVFYCHPYSSWERGSNERANGLIRRWFPKGTDFSKVTDAEIAKVEKWINNYPRTIFGGKTAEMMFQEQLDMLFSAA